jgi:subtilase family serine protease
MCSSPRPRRRTAPSLTLFVFSTLCLLAMALCLAPSAYAQNRDLVVAAVEPANRVALTGHHPAWASAQNDLGAVPMDLSLDHLVFVLARPPQLQQEFDQFLREQLDPASPNYHHWLTPVEIGERFGASQHDTDAITSWLQSQNLHLDSIANSRVRIQFSGPASAIANAFGAEMHYYLVDGEQRLSIAAEPKIPAALTGIIKSISGLYTINIRPFHGMGAVQVPASNMVWNSHGTLVPELTINSTTHFVTPSDFATIYDLNTGGINGAGQTIAIVGRSRVYAQDITNFQSLTGLSQQAPIEIVPTSPPFNGVDPGPPQTSPPTSGSFSKDQLEATLDVSRATSVAPGATIDLVVSSNTATANGIEIASQYVVDTNPVFAHIMNISFGACESLAGQLGDTFWDSLFSQAAAEGISVFVASGDAGAAGCDAYFSTPPASQTLSINFICASSHATCVGGTEFADTGNPSQYWSPNNSLTFGSALTYIPEGGWNEPVNSITGQPRVAASGGGVSAFIATPSWQTGTGVPGTAGRYTPDIAFSASAHDGYFACFAAGGGNCVQTSTGFSFVYFDGTSAAAPDMAGITALLNQQIGTPQGELNSRLYTLAATPSNNVFHDATPASSAVAVCDITIPSMCNNSTPGPTSQSGGLSGYPVGIGYDEVTGLGSIDVANLLAHWVVKATNTSVSSNLNPATVGASVTFTATVTSSASGTPTGTVTFLDNGASIGTGTLTSGAMATFATSLLTVGSHPITAQYGGDPNFTASSSTVITQIITLKPSATMLASSINPSVGGLSATFTATVTSTAGGTPTGTVAFSDGATSLGTGALSAGVATFTTSSLSMGSHSITASYGGDTNFAASTSSALSQAVNIAAFAPVSGTATVTAGQSVMINLTIYAASGSNLSLMLSCGSLPLKASCTFSPNPVVSPGPTGTPVTLTFSTMSSGLPANPTNRSPWPWGALGFSAALAALCAAGMIQLRHVPRHRLAFGMCICVIALASVLIGCGGGGYSTGPPPYTGTPKGTATFTVTGVSGATTISTPVSVTVQ